MLAMLIVLFMYIHAFHRFTDAEIHAYRVDNPGARIDLGNSVRTDPSEAMRFLYALNFPAILSAAALSSVLHTGPIQVGDNFTVGLYDICYFFCVCVLWYLVGVFMETRFHSTSFLALPGWTIIGLRVMGLACALVVGSAAVAQLVTESLVLKGQEVPIVGIIWCLVVVIYLFSSMRPYFLAKHPPSAERL